MRDYIRAGDIYQANIAQRFEAALPPGFDAFAFYRRLRARNPATFAAYLEGDGLTLASSSPERFLRLDRRAVETRPIKGTARRAADPAEDRARAEALAADPKERAENVMIVDLLRNDLSRICAPHSVAVPTLCGIETYAGVHHLVSAVTGTLKEGADGLDLLAATFPGGSITGAPKLRAMDIITEIEGDAREAYCGAIGWIGFDGSLDTSIAIRTVMLDATRAVLQAGGGVTLLSDPDSEYRETLTKAERVFRPSRPGRTHDPRHRQLRFLRLQRGALRRGTGRSGPGGAQRRPRRRGNPGAGPAGRGDLARALQPDGGRGVAAGDPRAVGAVPLLGVCLGHQCIGAAFGGRVERAARPLHGQATAIAHEGRALPRPAGAAHRRALPLADRDAAARMAEHLSVDAVSPEGEVMALTHRRHPTYGVQFHPESVLTERGHALFGNFLGLARRWHAEGGASRAVA